MTFKADVHGSCRGLPAGLMASLRGKIVGTRQADILLVVECEVCDYLVCKTQTIFDGQGIGESLALTRW